MSEVEFNKWFFLDLVEESYVGRTPGWDCLDLWTLLSGPALAALAWPEGCCEPWLLLCQGTAGLWPCDHCNSGVGLFS